MNRSRSLLAFCFFIFLAIALYGSFPFPKEAKVLPLLVLIPGTLVALWDLIAELTPKKHAPSKEKDPAQADRKRAYYHIFLSAISLPVLSWLWGITIGLPVFMFIYMRWVARESWSSTILSTLLTWVIIYLGFVVLVRSNFDNGVLINLILSLKEL